MLTGAAVAGSPFLGLIGQKPIIHDPYQNKNIKRMNWDQLQRAARPGDMILTNKRQGTGWKTTQTPQGSEFYHAQPVVARRGGRGLSASAGENVYSELRNLSPKQLLDYTRNIKTLARENHYSDVMLMRPDTPLTSAQQKAFGEEALKRSRNPYDKIRAGTAWLKDIFLPKIGPGSTDIPKGYQCKNDVCSTLPANAYAKATGKSPFPGKLPGDILPADYLREGSGYRPVGARLSYEGISPERMRMRNLGMRGGIGAGLGLGTYAAIEDPYSIPTLPAAVLTPVLAQKIMEQVKKRKALSKVKGTVSPKLRESILDKARHSSQVAFPSFNALLDAGKDSSKESVKIRSNMLRRSLPLGLLGGAGVYGLSQLLKNRVNRNDPETEK